MGALIISALAGLIAARPWGKRGDWVIGGVAFSHWILDLLVHRADLPILPGNFGGPPRLGFGLWATPAVAATLEAVLILVGGYMYFRAATSRPVSSVVCAQRAQVAQRAVVAAGVIGLLMVLALASDLMGIG